MLFHLARMFQSSFSGLNVVHYVSFRAMATLLTSLVFSFAFGQRFIALSKRLFRSKVRQLTPQAHQEKNNRPTMGGIFILINVVVNILLWCNLTKPNVWIFLFCILGFGALGLWDDWGKIKNHQGLSAQAKFYCQVGVATLVISLLLYCGFSTSISFPFFKWLNPNVGWWFIPWAVFIIVGCSNAVNLTDGLDGLAINSLIWNFATFSIICYLAGHYEIAKYLQIPFAHSAEMTVVGATLVGASIGFLWYNTYPAQIFMGDVGSLALGAGLALLALMCKQELLLPIAGGLFVLEAISVIVQVLSYKFLNHRIFKMAPIHHHFELLGWPESQITIRFSIISLILCLIALMTLKIR